MIFGEMTIRVPELWGVHGVSAPFLLLYILIKNELINSPPQAPIFAFCILRAPIRPRRGRVQLAKSAQTHLRCVWGDFCESAPGLCRFGTTKRLPMGARIRFLGHAPIRPRRGRFRRVAGVRGVRQAYSYLGNSPPQLLPLSERCGIL